MEYQETLRKLAVRDDRFVDSILSAEVEHAPTPGLGPRAAAMVRFSALITLDAPVPVYQWAVDEALLAGVTVDELVGVLMALMPTIGVPRVSSAAPKIGLALGYDIESALERH